MVRVSVVVPTLGRPEPLSNLLRHLERQSVAPHEVVVVESAMEESWVASFAAERPWIRYRRLPERGLPNARNVGVRLASGDVVLFIDDDVVPDRDLVRFHAEAYRDSDVAGV